MNDSVPDIAGRDLDISGAERNVLYALPFQPGESATVIEIAERTSSSYLASHHRLTRLVKLHLAEIVLDPVGYRRIASPIR